MAFADAVGAALDGGAAVHHCHLLHRERSYSSTARPAGDHSAASPPLLRSFRALQCPEAAHEEQYLCNGVSPCADILLQGASCSRCCCSPVCDRVSFLPPEKAERGTLSDHEVSAGSQDFSQFLPKQLQPNKSRLFAQPTLPIQYRSAFRSPILYHGILSSWWK